MHRGYELSGKINCIPCLFIIGIFLCNIVFCSRTPAVTLESENFKYTIGIDGKNRSFIDKRTGRNYLNTGIDSYCASVEKGGVEYTVTSVSLDGDKFLLEFADAGISVILNIAMQNDYLLFEVESVDGGSIESLVFVDIPLTLDGSVFLSIYCTLPVIFFSVTKFGLDATMFIISISSSIVIRCGNLIMWPRLNHLFPLSISPLKRLPESQGYTLMPQSRTCSMLRYERLSLECSYFSPNFSNRTRMSLTVFVNSNFAYSLYLMASRMNSNSWPTVKVKPVSLISF